MSKTEHHLLFNLIAPVYGLFFRYQKRHYIKVILKIRQQTDLTEYDTILDVGCGTGALCAALHACGLKVTGIDPAVRMLNIARRKANVRLKANAGHKINVTQAVDPVNKPDDVGIQFLEANVLKTLPFADNSFDIAISSYVAHGLQAEDRKKMYAEMSRVASRAVIIHDYNDRRSPLVTLVEWLEGGDYFRFIRQAEREMKDCLVEMKACFSDVRVVNVSKRANWYIGRPRG